MSTATDTTPVLSTPRAFTPGPIPEEKLKVEKDGLDVIHDIYRYAKSGFSTITDDDFTRMKWYGVYRQRPKDSGYFMLRTKIPGGQMTSAQLDVLTGLAEDFGHGFGDITTRQTIQYHWLKIEQFPEIFSRLAAVGMTTSGACGDDTRNIVSCPVAGFDKNEIIDANPQIAEVNKHLTDNREFSNLPRKYKISISGCCIHCAQPDINCLSFFGLKRTKEGKEECGYGVMVGGGLSSAPHMAQNLGVFLRADQVLPVAHYISVIYRDFGIRDKRSKARLKFLMADWGPDKFREKVEEYLGYKLDRHDQWAFPEDPETDHLGVYEQKQPGLFYVGICFAGGRVRANQLRKVAELARKYSNDGVGYIRNTNKQNLILVNIPQKNIEALKKELDDNNLIWNPSNFRTGCVACTGTEFCNLAIAETKNRMMELVTQLEDTAGFYKGKIRVHFSGCPSSCGQHQIADIGFRGAQTRVNGVMTEAFDMFIGGSTGKERKFNELLKGKVLAKDVHITIGKLLKHYEDNKQNDESFMHYVRRAKKEDMLAALI
ncbi:MAG: nitrite/sulfite reductase [Verrucomicrobiota bacterium]|nr:nitrite/sulfite reductase [Verrucomicrobiota bacterium]